MDFRLNDDQKMIRETAAKFVTSDSPVSRMRALRDDERGWEPSLWKRMAEMGWLGIPFAEEAGGFGGSLIDASLVIEQLGRTLVPEPYIESVVFAGAALTQIASRTQQNEILGPMIEGDHSLALAWAERTSRYRPGSISTKATAKGSHHEIHGEKVWVLNGHAADVLLVSARTETGISLFRVDPKAQGVRIESVKTMDGRRAATLHLDAAQGTLLGEEGQAELGLERALDYAAAAACSEGVGIVGAVLEMTVEYLKTRKQFGVPIGVFQALQHRAVDMFVETELCRSMALLANARAEESDDEVRRRAISAAKVQLTRGGFYVVAQGTQLHGGIGVTDEHDISLFFKRMRVLNALYGDAQFHIERFGAQPGFTADVA